MLKILYLGSEMVPFAKTGGLADVAGALPKALASLGHDVMTVLPHYHSITRQLHFFENFHIHIAGIRREGAFLYNGEDGVHRFFVHHPHYYDRNGVYADSYGDYGDNDERFAYFCEAALLLCKIRNWKPDIIHLNDWQTGILGPILRHKYATDPFFYGTKLVFTIHNLAYQGYFDGGCYKKFGLPDEVMRFDGMGHHNSASFLKAGIEYSDFITTVSPTYAREILTSEYGAGFEGILQAHQGKLLGILNGIDVDEWDPSTDRYLGQFAFDINHLDRKEELKKAFLESCGLPYWPHVPLLGMVCRFTAQKGIHLVSSAMEDILRMGSQIVVLGSGDHDFARSLQWFSQNFPKQVRSFHTFSDELAHQIEGASDFFLMPSRYEPCGLNQMYSLRYGTLPIVYHTGGLADTVRDCDTHPASGNGYSFIEYTKDAFVDAARRAIGLHHSVEMKNLIQKRAMSEDFSWNRSARGYERVYFHVLSV